MEIKKIGQLASRIERNGRRRSLRGPKLSAIKGSSAPGRRRRRRRRRRRNEINKPKSLGYIQKEVSKITEKIYQNQK
jgi:hypothetical protein